MWKAIQTKRANDAITPLQNHEWILINQNAFGWLGYISSHTLAWLLPALYNQEIIQIELERS